MANNLYRPKNERGKTLIAAGTPKSQTDAKATDFLDLSWLDTQDNLTFGETKKVVSTDALKALADKVDGIDSNLEFKFVVLESVDALPTQVTSTNVDTLRRSIYLVKIGTETTGTNIYEEYVCTNTSEFSTTAITAKFEKFGVGVGNATISGSVKLSDTASSTQDATGGVAATPKAVATAQAAAQAAAEATAAAALEAAQEELEEAIETAQAAAQAAAEATAAAALEEAKGELEEAIEAVDTKVDAVDTKVDELAAELAAAAKLTAQTATLTVPATGSVTTKLPEGATLIRFEEVSAGGDVTTHHPAIKYGATASGETTMTFKFWDEGGAPEGVTSATITLHYLAVLTPEIDEEEEEEEDGDEQGS